MATAVTMLATGSAATAAAPPPAPGTVKPRTASFAAAKGNTRAAVQSISEPGDDIGGCNFELSAWSTPHQIQVAGPPGVPPETVTLADVETWGDYECSAGLTHIFMQSSIVDRTSGYNGKLLALGYPTQQSYPCAGCLNGSSAGASVYDEWQDNGRYAEGILDLYLDLPSYYQWTSCTPPPGTYILLCLGLGTPHLHEQLGTGAFSTGLKPPVVRLVALGDSYASGTNAQNYDPGVPACYRSANAYYRYLYNLSFNGMAIQRPTVRACHGAVISDITSTQSGSEGPQISVMNARSTRLVTISIGGNDLGFSSVLTKCWLLICSGPLLTPAQLQDTQTRLTALYRQLRNTMRADGTLVVLTYPAIIPRVGEPTCSAIDNHFSEAERTALDDAWLSADNMIKSAVAATGDPRIRVVDLYHTFDGHKICSPNEAWASPYDSNDSNLSFHPNASGHCAIVRQLKQELGITGTLPWCITAIE